MGLPVKLRSSQSAPNLFSDWNNFSEFDFQKIGEVEEGGRSQKKMTIKIGSETHSNDVNTIKLDDLENRGELNCQRKSMTSLEQGFFFSEHSMSLVEANDLKLVVTRETGSRTGPHHPLHPPNVRPLIIGGGLVGLTLSSFLYLLPSLLCTTTFHPFLATIYLMSALSAPLIASVMFTDLRKICIANIIAFLGLTFIAGLYFVPDSIVASISGILIGPIIATLDAGSLNVVFKLTSHRQQQQQKSGRISLLRKYLFASRGLGNILLGAIFALVLLLSTLHNHQTLTRNTSMTEDAISQETYNINYNNNFNNFNNSNNSLHTTLQEMTINEKTLVMGHKGISLPTQMMITNSESSFFRRQQHCLNAKKSSTSEYSAMTVWRTFIVSMSIIFAVAILMYLLVIVLFSSETRKSPKSHFHHDFHHDRSEFQVNADDKKCKLPSKCGKNGLSEILEFYLTNVRIHAFTPIVFFAGMHEAFMARDFVNGIVHQVLGIESVCLAISLMGFARLISTWVSSHASEVGPPYTIIVFTNIFQSGLFAIFLKWTPSEADPGMFFATTFIWGTTSAAWEFIILSRASFFFRGNWNSASSVLSFYKFFSMALMFSLDTQVSTSNQRVYVLIVCLLVAVIPIIILEKHYNRNILKK